MTKIIHTYQENGNFRAKQDSQNGTSLRKRPIFAMVSAIAKRCRERKNFTICDVKRGAGCRTRTSAQEDNWWDKYYINFADRGVRGSEINKIWLSSYMEAPTQNKSVVFDSTKASEML